MPVLNFASRLIARPVCNIFVVYLHFGHKNTVHRPHSGFSHIEQTSQVRLRLHLPDEHVHRIFAGAARGSCLFCGFSAASLASVSCTTIF